MGLKISYIILLGFSCCFTSCYPQQGQRGASENIEDSKKRGVFICEYYVSQNPYKINDSLKITVKEAWVEKQWKYSKGSETLPYNQYQLLINSKEDDLKGVDFKWSIGDDQDCALRSSGHSSLIGDFKNMPKDTLIFPIQQGEAFAGNTINIIGKFVLIKKGN